jgi:hypothetical protein
VSEINATDGNFEGNDPPGEIEEYNQEIEADDVFNDATYNLRTTRSRNYDHCLSHKMDHPGSVKNNDMQLLQFGISLDKKWKP